MFVKIFVEMSKCSCIPADQNRIWISKLTRFRTESLLAGSESVPGLLICRFGHVWSKNRRNEASRVIRVVGYCLLLRYKSLL